MQEQLKLYRKLKDITQIELGEVLGVSGNTIARWERGEMKMSKNNRKKFQNILDSSIR